MTHDQGEAMSLSDRVAVINAGRIEQIGPPGEVYHRPRTRFVAQFVGDANVLPVEQVAANGRLTTVRILETGQELAVGSRLDSREARVVLRPEMLRLEASGASGLSGRVIDVAFLGSSVTYRVDVGGAQIRVQEAGLDVRPRFSVGDPVSVLYEPERCMLLGADSEPRLEGG